MREERRTTAIAADGSTIVSSVSAPTSMTRGRT
jgi:hypothetical protein